MILHVVLCRWLPGAGADALASLDAALQALPSQVPDILDWQCGPNTTPDGMAWDYALVARFADREALEAYFVHPAHEAALAQLSALAELRFADIRT